MAFRIVIASYVALALAVPAAANTGGALVILGGISSEGGSGARAEQGYRAPVTKPTLIDFPSALAPGSIIIRTGERKLYLIEPQGKALVYSVGVGREGFTWSGRNRITRKAQWPDWRPPLAMIEREARRNHFIPTLVKGGVNNPLGARALYIGDTEYRIHGTTQPWSIGRAVSSGCIRLVNEDVIDLYERVAIGATVVVE